MNKRILSMILVVCMVLALLPTGTVFAVNAETSDVYDVNADTEIMPASVVDDHTPPTVTGVYMNSPGGTVTVGDKLEFSVTTEDESGISGTSRLDFTFMCQQNHNHIAMSRMKSYDKDTKQAVFELTITDDMLNGTYKLSYVSIWDTYGNWEDFYPANPTNPNDPGHPGAVNFDSVTFTITGSSAREDHTPPAVSGVHMSDPGRTVTVGDKLEFSVATEDESGISGTSRLDFTFICQQNHNHIAMSRMKSYDKDTKQAVFELTITDDMLNGTYKLSYVSIWDTYGNWEDFYPANPTNPNNPGHPGNIDFDSVTFTVTGSSATEDHTPPTVSGVYMSDPGRTVTVGDKLEFSVATEDESGISGTSRLDFTFICQQNHNHIAMSRMKSYDKDTKQAVFELTITDDMLNGTYKLSYVSIWDTHGNWEDFYPANPTNPSNPGHPGAVDFDSIYFTIAIPDILPEDVSIPKTLSLPVRSTQTIRPTVTPVDSLPKWTWVSADTGIAEVVISENNKSCTITGVAPGTTTITGTTQNGLTATCTVTVTDAPVPESGTVNESYQVGVGGYVDILPVLTPVGATTLYEVTSDNPHVASAATVNGQEGIRIQGNVPGKAAITIRGANGLVMTTTVTVGRDSDQQHEKVTDPAIPATCTTPGRSERVRCSACWYVFTEAEEIPATGHSFGADGRCTVCGYRETTSNPGGNPGGSSGSSTGDYGWTPPTTSSQNISAGEQKLPVTVSNGAVNVTATDKQIENAVADSKETGVFKIDMTAVANASEVKIPQKMVNAIQDSGDVSGLSVTAKSGSIEMSAAALDTVSNALTGSGDQLSLKIDTVDVNKIPSTQKYPIANVLNTAVFVELSATVVHPDGSRDPIHEFNGNVTVSIPYEQPANVAGRQVIACHIADDGAITYFPVRYENGMVTFTTTHFSTFAVVESYAAAFSDIDVGAWYMLSVEYALDQQFMNGVGDGLFAPNENLSRGMLAQILYNKEGNPAVDGTNVFADIPSSAWYADAVTWASAKGIVDGYGNGSFGPNDNITREQLAVMLWRYAGMPVPPNLLLNFTDAYQASDYAQDALRWAVEKGIISGKGNGILDPAGKATRAEAAEMLRNYMNTVL